MSNLDDYLKKRGITEEQMEVARQRTQAYIDAYNLAQARKASHMTQAEMAKAMGVSQNRVSRIENGDMEAMSLSSIRRYIEALGGQLTLEADLPIGRIDLSSALGRA